LDSFDLLKDTIEEVIMSAGERESEPQSAAQLVEIGYQEIGVLVKPQDSQVGRHDQNVVDLAPGVEKKGGRQQKGVAEPGGIR
jgi:hypothetical protein